MLIVTIISPCNASSFDWPVKCMLQGFDAYVGFERYWLQYLPKSVPPSSCPQLDAFQQACNQCEWLWHTVNARLG